MNKTCTRFLLVLSLLFLWQSAGAITRYTFVGGGVTGNWNVANTWTTDPTGASLVNPGVPAASDVLNILSGFTVTLSANTPAAATQVINIASGGTLDLVTFDITSTVSTLSGQGALRIKRNYFPTITTNNFTAAGGGTVVYYDFGVSPAAMPNIATYNNLRLENTTTNALVYVFGQNTTVNGTFAVSQQDVAGSLRAQLGANAAAGRTFNFVGNVTTSDGAGISNGTTTSRNAVTFQRSVTSRGLGIDLANNVQYNATNNVQSSNVTFSGTTPATLACNAPVEFATMTVSKGAAQEVLLSVTSTAVANFKLMDTGTLLTLQNGTLRLGSNIQLNRLRDDADNWDLGTPTLSPQLWVDGAEIDISNCKALVVYGTFKMTAGDFKCQGPGVRGTVVREDGAYVISGGTFTTEQFRTSNTSSTHRGSFTMTGGTLNAIGTGSAAQETNYARFSLGYPDQTFVMSGGTINVGRTIGVGSIHLGMKAGNYTVTGGTWNALLTGPDANFIISSTVPFWNLNIVRTAVATTTKATLAGIGAVLGTQTAAQPLVVSNRLGFTGTFAPTLDANGQDVRLAGDIDVPSGATFTPGAGTTLFFGSNSQTFTANGTVNNFTQLTVNKTGNSVKLAGVSSLQVAAAGTLYLQQGVLDDNGRDLLVAGTIRNEATHTSSGGVGSIKLNGTGNQVLTGNGLGVFGNLTILSTAGVGTVAAVLQSNEDIAGILTLQSQHVLDLATFRLHVTNTSPTAIVAGAGGFSAQRMLRTAGNQSDGGLRKTWGTVSAFTFPVGTVGRYAPATITLTAAPAFYGKITVVPVPTRHPIAQGSNNALTYWWKTRAIDFVNLPANSVTHRYTYNAADVVGTESAYVPGRYQPVSWVMGPGADVNTVAKTIDFPLTQSFGEFSAGQPSAFATVIAFYSIRDGVWTNTTPGQTPWSIIGFGGAETNLTPTSQNPVLIGDGLTNNHTVTVTANTARSGALQIANGSVLDVGITTGHDFGALPDAVIGGSGRLRIASATPTAQFPGGDFGEFIGASGGEVEYYSVGATDFTVPLTSASGGQLPNYYVLVANPGAGRTITLPNRALRMYSELRVGDRAGFTGQALISATALGNLTVDSNLVVLRGTLRLPAATVRALTVGRDVTIGTGAAIDVAASGAAVQHTLTVSRSVTNNGTLRLDNGGSRVATLTFTSARNALFTGTTPGALTVLNRLLVDKGTSQTPVLRLDVLGTLTTPASGWLRLMNGTLRYAKGSALSVSNKAWTIAETAALSVDNASASVNIATAATDTTDLSLIGRLELLQGAVNIGDLTATFNNDIAYSSAGQPTVSVVNGTLTVNGQVRRGLSSTVGDLNWSQSGGTVVLRGRNATVGGNEERAILEVANPFSSFSMSGGTLQIERTNGVAGVSQVADLYLRPALGTGITGGTIILGGTTGGTQQIDVDVTMPVNNLTVTGATGNACSARILYNALYVMGDLTIDNSFAFFNANGLDVTLEGSLINRNTTATAGVAVGGYRPGVATQTTTFASRPGRVIQGLTASLTNFGNVVVAPPLNSTTLTLGLNAMSGIATAVRVNGQLTLENGTLADNGNLISVVGTISNSAAHTSAAGGAIALVSATPQTLTGSGLGKFGNLSLNATGGGILAAPQEITGTLAFNTGVNTLLNIGSYLLRLTNTAANSITGFSSSRYIVLNGVVADDGVRKSYPALTPTDFTFPVGVAGKYTPARINVTANGNAAGTVTMRPVNSKHPATTSAAATELTYYWIVSQTGFASPTITHVYNYLQADVQGTEASYVGGRFVGNLWTTPGVVNAGGNTITLTGVNYLAGDYTAGLAAEFGTVDVYYSRAPAGGNWNDVNSWTFSPTGIGAAVATAPTSANPVVILTEHTISANGTTRASASLELRGTGKLDLGATTANNFGLVTGTGTLTIGSAVFPAGNYADFVAPNAGTIEYTAAVTIPPRTTYNNLLLSGNNTKRFNTVPLTINGALQVVAGVIANYADQDMVLVSPTVGDVTTAAGTTLDFGNGNITVGHNLNAAGTITCGTEPVSIANEVNVSGTGLFLTQAGGDLIVGANLLNAGDFRAGAGAVTVGGSLTNSGTYLSNVGALLINNDFDNAGGTFIAAASPITITQSFTNGGDFRGKRAVINIGTDFTNFGLLTAGQAHVVLNGHWTNFGIFNPDTSLVRFDLPVMRAAAGGRTLTGATTFYDVEKTGPGDLTLLSDATVNRFFTLTSGNVVTGSNLLAFTYTPSQPLLNPGENGYVDGRVSMAFPNTAATSRRYPVGKGSIYRPVEIRQESTSSSPVVSVEMFETRPTGTVLSPLTNISRFRYYRVEQVSGTSVNPRVQLSFNNQNLVDETANVPGNLRIAQATSPSGPWSNGGGSGVFSPVFPSGFAVSAPLASLGTPGFFSLASTNAFDNPLPVELTAFDATPAGATVRTAWQTASEQNSAWFVVERAAQATGSFTEVGRRAGAGTSAAPHDYSLTDSAPLAGLSYYRLRMLDQDGTTTFSQVVTVRRGSTPLTLTVAPNPVAALAPVRLLTTGIAAQTAAVVTITDFVGRVVATRTALVTPSGEVLLPVALPAGLYVVRCEAAGSVFTSRLTVE